MAPDGRPDQVSVTARQSEPMVQFGLFPQPSLQVLSLPVTLRRDHQKPRQASKPTAATPAPSQERALADLAAGQFRKAIDNFKALSRTEPAAVWQPGLAAAYRGRALELEVKGMGKEALTIWENRARACPGLAPDPRHLALLLRLDRAAPALAAYRHLVAAGESPALNETRARFAAHFLVEDLPAILAQDPDFAADPLVRDNLAARAALAAYCAGDDDQVADQLKGIPFRSPYRDLATLLKVLTGPGEDLATRDKLLERIPANSPFASLARTIRLAQLPDEDLYQALGEASEAARDFVMSLLGWPERRRQLWRELRRLGDHPSINQWITLLRRYRALLGEPWLRHQVRALVMAEFPRKVPAPLLAELRPLDTATGIALTGEKHSPPATTHRLWMEAIDTLCPEGQTPAPGSQDALRLALIHRRLGRELNRIKGSRLLKVEQGLIASLDLDPDYLPGYLHLISHYRQAGRLKEARPIMDQALRRWPEDPEVLNEALDLALASDAFKKAAGLAKRILDRDPINRRARQSLFKAHLAHARKQINKSRFDLAHKELEQAAGWGEGAASLARVELLRGIMAWLHGTLDKETLSQACAALGGGLTGRLALALEAEQLRFSPQTLLKQASLLPLPPPDRDDLLAYCRLLRAQVEQEDFKPRTAWEPFQASLRKAAGLPLDMGDFETVCETLRLVGLAQLRLDFAKAALKRWPAKPLFVFHQYEAREALGHWDQGRWMMRHPLDDALDQARAEGDQRTAHRIGEMLGLLGHLEADDDFDDYDEFEAEADFGLGGGETPLPEAIANLDPQFFIDLLRKVMGPAFKEMERTYGKDVLGGIRKMVANGEIPDLPRDLIEFLIQQPTQPPKTPPQPPLKPPSRPKPAPRGGRRAGPGSDDDNPGGQQDLF